MIEQELSAYISKWQAVEGIKPQNEKEFIDLFYKLILDYPDDREVSFDGDGAYFGKQVTLEPFSFYGKVSRNLRFEVAYDNENIRVYSANHDGYWIPEYITLTKGQPEADALILAWMHFLRGVFGLI